VLDFWEEFIGDKLLLVPSMEEEEKGELGHDDGLCSWPDGLRVQGKYVQESGLHENRKR
jgi:hypothetical protein